MSEINRPLRLRDEPEGGPEPAPGTGPESGKGLAHDILTNPGMLAGAVVIICLVGWALVALVGLGCVWALGEAIGSFVLLIVFGLFAASGIVLVVILRRAGKDEISRRGGGNGGPGG